MAPRWFRDDADRRSSVLSLVAPQQSLPSEHPFFDQDSLHASQDRTRRISTLPSDAPALRKRYSIFAKAAPPADGVADNPRWPRIFREPSSVTEMTAPVEYVAPTPTARHNRRSITIRQSRNDPIVKWMRRVERVPFAASEEEVSRDLRKAGISEPFDFKHVTHHGARELPELDFTSQNDLTRSFWAACAHQVPQSDLRGIRADQLSTGFLRSRPSSVVSSRASASAAASASASAAASEPVPSLALLRSSRSFSGPSSEVPRRPSLLSRSASFASLIAEPREPPAMVHPAFRKAEELTPPESSVSWSLPPGLQTPASEANRNLDVVLEEAESPSPVKRPGRLGRFPAENARHSASDSASGHRDFTPSMRSDDRDASTLDQYDTSATSLSSGETWEEDVDFCYNMEAESTCDFQWRGRKVLLASPRDSFVTTPRAESGEVGHRPNVSPRTSMVTHQRNKSSMTMTAATSSPLSSSDAWPSLDASDVNPLSQATDSAFALRHLAMHLDLDWQSGDESRAGRSESVSRVAAPVSYLNRLSASSSIRDAHSSVRGSDHQSHTTTPTGRPVRRSSRLDVTEGRLVVDTCAEPASHPAPSPPPTAPLPPLPTQAKQTSPQMPPPTPKRHTMPSITTTVTDNDHVHSLRSATSSDRCTLVPGKTGASSTGLSIETARPHSSPDTKWPSSPDSDWF